MHPTALTENAINLLKRPKISKYLFEVFQKIQNFKNGKSGGLELFNCEENRKNRCGIFGIFIFWDFGIIHIFHCLGSHARGLIIVLIGIGRTLLIPVAAQL